jgi:hypothetical protein
LRWRRLEFVPPDARFRDHAIEGEIAFENALSIETTLQVAASGRGTNEIEFVRPLLEHCARWTHTNRSAITAFLHRSLNDEQGLEMGLSDLSFDRIVVHTSHEDGDYFAIWCSCRAGTPIAFVSLDDLSFFGDAENYW